MDIYNTALFYSNLIGNRLLSFSYEKPLSTSHLKPIEDFLFNGKELTPFSQELFTYKEARECVLDFDIYTIQENYKKFPIFQLLAPKVTTPRSIKPQNRRIHQVSGDSTRT